MNIERPNLREHISSVDFLSEETRLQLSLAKEAALYLPQISTEELETRKEQFRILLGKIITEESGLVTVHIQSVLEMDEQDHGYYQEGIEMVTGVNIPAIKSFVENLKEGEEDYGEFIGDIHTHPIQEKDFEDGIKPWDPSSEDIDDVVRNYESGALASDKPYIFGIASPDDEGNTLYSFYRIVKKEQGYSCVRVE